MKKILTAALAACLLLLGGCAGTPLEKQGYVDMQIPKRLLAAPSKEALDGLRFYFAASKDWQMTAGRNGVIALRTAETTGEKQQVGGADATFCFNSGELLQNDSFLSPSTKAEKESQQLELVSMVGKSNLLLSALQFDYGDTGLIVQEAAASRERVKTRELLTELDSLFAVVEAGTQLDELYKDGSIVREKKATLEINYTQTDGRAAFSGYVNPGEPGTLSLRTTSTKDNVVLVVDRAQSQNSVYTGYSDKAESFYYSGFAILKDAPNATETPVKYELVFQPDNANAAERVLLSKDGKVGNPKE